MENTKYTYDDVRAAMLDHLKEAGIKLPIHTNTEIGTASITIGMQDTDKGQMAFGSEVTIYVPIDKFLEYEKIRISFGSCGSFDPSNKASTSRVILAASILENWDKVVEILKKFHKLANQES